MVSRMCIPVHNALTSAAQAVQGWQSREGRSACSNCILTRQPLWLYSACTDDLLTLRQKLISLRTSMMETSWGVVTMMAPSTLEAFNNCAIEMCSSDVLQQGSQLATGWYR